MSIDVAERWDRIQTLGKQTPGNEAMTIELTDEQKRMIDLAVASGVYHDSHQVIGTALAMLYEDIEDGIISDARVGDSRFSLDEVEAELRSLGKIK